MPGSKGCFNGFNGFPYSHDGTFRLVAVGATDVGNIAFLVSDPSKTLDQAREAAIADARRKAEVYAQASSLQLRRVEWITEDAGFAPPGPMRAQGASVPMAVSVPIATGEETLQPPAKRHCELGLQLASILPIDPRFEDGAP
jgi:hypothetical protein